MQCEGWRRRGGAFTLGHVTWTQCESEAVVTLTVTQDEKTAKLPACTKCWKEAIANDIEITECIPI